MEDCHLCIKFDAFGIDICGQNIPIYIAILIFFSLQDCLACFFALVSLCLWTNMNNFVTLSLLCPLIALSIKLLC